MKPVDLRRSHKWIYHSPRPLSSQHHARPQTQGSTTSSTSPSLQEGLTQFLKAKSKGDESGNYRRNAKRVITRWIDWLEQRDVDTFEQLDETILAYFAECLRRRVAAKESETTDGGIARSTAWTYYNTISAFLGWASKWGYIQENYARAGLAPESMPDRSTTQQTEQQFWTPEQREQILNYVKMRAHDAIDEKGLDAEVEARDRALVAVLAFTGVRGSEIFRSEHDNRTGRQRIRWRDVDLDEQTISVLGKNQQRQSAWLRRPRTR